MEPKNNFPPSTLVNSSCLQRKLLNYFGICFCSCLVVFFLQYFLGLTSNKSFQAFPQLARYVRGTLYLFPSISASGLVVLLLKPWTELALFLIDITFSVFFLLALSFVIAAVFPGQGFLYPYVLLLFLHAALVPCRGWVQAVLGVITLLSFALGRIYSYDLLSETQKILMADDGGGEFWKFFFLESVFLTLTAAIATDIVNALSSMRSTSELQGHFGNYIIKKFLGTGGMGKVYLATHTSMCRPTALKIMEPKAEDFTTALSRFEREVKLCSTLCHPNTVTIFDFGRCGDSTLYYAMEYLEGLDLQKMVEKFGPLPVNRVVYILKKMCSALAEAHSKKIVHRDIKPSNIFLACLGGIFDFVKVLDFGLAKEIDAKDPHLTESHVFLGTPAYVAPEMIIDRRHVDQRTDLYMCGCVAFWTLTGQAPFRGDNDAQVLLEHVKSLPRWPSELTSGEIPVQLEHIVMRCLEKRMEDRFQNVGELCSALESIPLEKPWDQADAREWWNHHRPEDLFSQEQLEIEFTAEPQPIAAAGPHPL